MRRRDFLSRVCTVSALGVVGGSCGPRTEERGAPAGGALDPPLERVGLQLYTVRSLMAEDVVGTLDAVAAVGYREVEFAGYFETEPGVLRSWLDASGLEAPAAHVDLRQLGPDLESTLEAASVLGHRWIVLPSIPADQRTRDGYPRIAEILNEAGERASGSGLRVAFHNHAVEFEPVDGVPGYELLVRALDPAFVDLEIDFHWSAVGGARAEDLFAAFPGRFALCHVKDLTADGRMVEVGAGDIDWAGIFALSELAGLRHYFVEHDQPADPIESIRASYRYLSGG